MYKRYVSNDEISITSFFPEIALVVELAIAIQTTNILKEELLKDDFFWEFLQNYIKQYILIINNYTYTSTLYMI